MLEEEIEILPDEKVENENVLEFLSNNFDKMTMSDESLPSVMVSIF